jgi:hypothetical protein
LTTVVQGIGELRNQYGSGHGKKASFKGLTARHAKLSVGAASTLAIFLLEKSTNAQHSIGNSGADSCKLNICYSIEHLCKC